MDGYLEGYEAAYEDYIYDDFKRGLNEEEQIIYKKGYYAGFIEGGGGTLLEILSYYLFKKNPLYSIIILVFIFFIILLTVNLRNEQTGASPNVTSNVDTNLDRYPEPSYKLDNEAYDKIIEVKNFSETIDKVLNKKINNTKDDSVKHFRKSFYRRWNLLL
ncbi:hypothetical protein [Bacillus sp. T33-2]|uniref:hypothetical protein n=1 Tax=Bacillus sp. T33-2 TaxID=2054168 RepID=UPI000C762F91|nr:hypothetical protein [Bacillus sp. T33-2]PLR94597.1 hypothetical protein CVD19_16625 [Bacillus sp. T33-2]